MGCVALQYVLVWLSNLHFHRNSVSSLYACKYLVSVALVCVFFLLSPRIRAPSLALYAVSVEQHAFLVVGLRVSETRMCD